MTTDEQINDLRKGVTILTPFGVMNVQLDGPAITNPLGRHEEEDKLYSRPRKLSWTIGAQMPEHGEDALLTVRGEASAAFRGEYHQPGYSEMPGSDPASRIRAIEARRLGIASFFDPTEWTQKRIRAAIAPLFAAVDAVLLSPHAGEAWLACADAVAALEYPGQIHRIAYSNREMTDAVRVVAERVENFARQEAATLIGGAWWRFNAARQNLQTACDRALAAVASR